MTDRLSEFNQARDEYGPGAEDTFLIFLLWRIAESLEVIADAQLEASFRPEDGEDWKDESDEDE